ncbi:FMN-binding glutamate synthase family protein [Oceaniserpentilla sp. 4NH20-0058]|uniref:FMN-binding glutamate synthase family protein n=1 Tax=Oceaniserpentilla sp. 4NH20-0058 TaxID=3127660 RepID=UPI00310BDAEB
MTTMQKVLLIIATIGNGLAVFWLWLSPNTIAMVLLSITILYSLIGLHDVLISKHTLNRLYPVAAYMRYLLESFRAEVQQYFIASNTEELPFNHEQRSLVYQRAKNERDTIAFGTQRNLLEQDYLSLWPSLQVKKVLEETKRVTFGSKDCTQPYQAALLNISAMSFGALSPNAIEALNLGAKKGNFFHNTGEGGVSPYHLKHGGDLVWQIGSGLFGCRTEDGEFDAEKFKQTASLSNIKMIEIKLSQGAKPGHGGVLPKSKISDEIATIRGVNKHQDCISPSNHPKASSPKALLAFIQELRTLSDGKPIGFKLCLGNPAEFLSICKAMLETNILPDFITIDGAEGGTGAAPVEFSNRLGMTCLEATYIVNNALIGCGIRDQIKLISAGKTASSFDLLSKLAMGADTVNAARTMMMALGCIQSRSCNTNHCPTGIATQDPARGHALNIQDKSQRVANFQRNTLYSFFELVGSMGLDNPNLLTPNMLKRRTSSELSVSMGSLVPQLNPNALVHSQSIDGPWKEWWDGACSEAYHADDIHVLGVPSLIAQSV